MFNYDAQGDFNVSRKNLSGSIKVFDADMNVQATFNQNGDGDADMVYAMFVNGLVAHGGNSLFDLDTGQFIVGDVGQLTRPTVPVVQHPVSRSDWQRYDLGKNYFLSHHIPSHSVHVYWHDTFLDAGAWGYLDKLADNLMTVGLSAAAVDRPFVRDRVLEVKDRFDTPAKAHPLGSDRYAD